MFVLFDLARSYLGVPYRWGGANRWEGFDCSGFIIELLRSVGEAPPGDTTAQGLFDYYSNGRASWNVTTPGSLVFFGDSATQIRHVGLLADNGYRMYEAAGGDSSTLTLEDAIRRNAQVRISLIADRKDSFKAILRPYYRKIGHI